ncbi:MAG: phenylalanine--tRNA ligase subunit alpha [Patescibacteria group bacterium]
MEKFLTGLKKKALMDVSKAADRTALEAVRVGYLGRKGELTALLRSLKDLPLEERRRLGPEANALRGELEAAIQERSRAIAAAEKIEERLDITKPGHRMPRGHLHLLSKVDAEVRRIFTSLNFSVVEGPELETAYHNFNTLNIPADHPARDAWDTFWIRREGKSPMEQLLLRTHTSPVQIRYMQTHEPPFQIIAPGRVFRYEATDASHAFNFYQVEGLMVGSDVSLANFKYVVETFLVQFFGKGTEFRFRPSYFPFVEPGLEVDMRRKGGDWLEVMGAGMVHRNVFDAVRYNPDPPAGGVQGFAFGMGLDRLAMLRYNVPDIRLFYSGDVRFTQQF